jgi:hypothetical protein
LRLDSIPIRRRCGSRSPRAGPREPAVPQEARGAHRHTQREALARAAEQLVVERCALGAFLAVAADVIR